MGRTFQFDCPHCRYQACVSGGAAAGLNCAVQTIVCLDCRRLFDVFTRLRQRVGAEKPPPAKAKRKSGSASRLLVPVGLSIPPLALMENVWSVFLPKKRRPKGPKPQWHWETVKPACPVTGSHRIKFWSAPGRCPRCGTLLEKTGFPYRWWD